MNNVSEDRALRQMLKEGQPIAVFPRGVSMRPLIRQGKTCVGLLPLTKEPQIGDIVAFIRPSDDANVIHRLVAIEGDAYITRGDNCLCCEQLRRADIFGVAAQISTNGKTISVTDERYLRYVRFWMRTWPMRRQLFRLRALYQRMRRAMGRTRAGMKLKAILRGNE